MNKSRLKLIEDVKAHPEKAAMVISYLLQKIIELFKELREKDNIIDSVKKPEVTSQMKADCIGEFSWEEDAPYYDEDGNIIEHTATRTVPWDLCKDIYKAMHESRFNDD